MKSMITAIALILTMSSADASTVLITGTNRGIGLELVKQYAEKGWTVIATARNPDAATDLKALAAKHKSITVEKLDVTDVKAIEALAAKHKGKPIDVLINNAGTLGDVQKQTAGTLDQTLIVFTGDHGYFYGEHGLSVERRLPYEESIRIPLAMRHPGLVPERNSKRDQTVLTLDLAPTFLEIGGAKLPDTLQGKSLAALMKQSGPELRDGFLIEYYSDTVFPRMKEMGYQAVRTRDWKYVHYLHIPDADELYDMNRDPYEMRNLATSARHQDKLALMKKELTNQIQETKAPKR